MARRQPPTPTPVTPTRRRPVWNGYLTDGARYRLSEQQQLQRQLQQLSTAHFAATPTRRRPSPPLPSPSGWSAAASASTADVKEQTEPQGEETTPSSQMVARTRPGSSDSMRRRKVGATVSFKLGHDDDAQRGLQGELAVLERMLFELETESVTLNQAEAAQQHEASFQEDYSEERVRRDLPEDGEQSRSVLSSRGFASDDEYESGSGDSDAENERGSDGDTNDEHLMARESRGPARLSQAPPAAFQIEANPVADPTLSQVCYKSLSIGVELAKRVEQLSRELDRERRQRVDSELKIEILEQEVRSTRAKCNYLDAKYQDVASQVNDMREALIATEEAIHRMAKQQQMSGARRTRASKM